MNNLKRLTAAIAAAGLIISYVPAVSAETGDILYDIKNYSRTEIELTELILSAIRQQRTDEIDVSRYKMSFSEFEDIYVTAVLNEPELFYASSVQAYLTYYTKDCVETFRPCYTCSPDNIKSRSAKIKAYAKDITDDIDDSFTEAEKVLYVRERLGADIVYHQSSDAESGRNVYDAFIKNRSICVGYALGFQYLMDMLDIPCVNVYSDEHIWNMVEIDGEWYHSDLTWDDSAELTAGFLSHNSVLESDTSILNSVPPHESWEYGPSAESTDYDKFFWEASYMVMCRYDGRWYYSAPDGLYSYSFADGKSKRIFSFKKKWSAGDGLDWSISFSHPLIYRGNIIFNDSEKIYRYDPKKKTITVVYKPALDDGEALFDLSLSGSKLIFTVTDDIISGSKTRRSIRLPQYKQ